MVQGGDESLNCIRAHYRVKQIKEAGDNDARAL